MKKNLLLTFVLLVSCAYDPCSRKLILINDTKNSIYFQLETDTVPYFHAKSDIHKFFTLLYFYDTAKPCMKGGGDARAVWTNQINKYGIDSALHIFIFPTDRITEKMIRERDYVRLSYTVKELDSLNWTVVYSGQNE